MSDEYNPEREAILCAILSVDVSELTKRLVLCGRMISAESLLYNASLLFDEVDEFARETNSENACRHAGYAHAALTSARAEYHRAKKSKEVE